MVTCSILNTKIKFGGVASSLKSFAKHCALSYSKHLIFQFSHFGRIMGSLFFNTVCNLSKFSSLTPSDCGVQFVRALAVHRTDSFCFPSEKNLRSTDWENKMSTCNWAFGLMGGFPLVLSTHLAV